jgi:hypothetical protein
LEPFGRLKAALVIEVELGEPPQSEICMDASVSKFFVPDTLYTSECPTNPAIAMAVTAATAALGVLSDNNSSGGSVGFGEWTEPFNLS